MALCAALGVTIERLAYRPLRKAPRLNVLITAIGVSLFLQNVGQLDKFFGNRPSTMSALLAERRARHASAACSSGSFDMLTIGLTVVLVVFLERIVYGTKMGRAMRAVSFDERDASLMGINVNSVVDRHVRARLGARGRGRDPVRAAQRPPHDGRRVVGAARPQGVRRGGRRRHRQRARRGGGRDADRVRRGVRAPLRHRGVPGQAVGRPAAGHLRVRHPDPRAAVQAERPARQGRRWRRYERAGRLRTTARSPLQARVAALRPNIAVASGCRLCRSSSRSCSRS